MLLVLFFSTLVSAQTEPQWQEEWKKDVLFPDDDDAMCDEWIEQAVAKCPGRPKTFDFASCVAENADFKYYDKGTHKHAAYVKEKCQKFTHKIETTAEQLKIGRFTWSDFNSVMKFGRMNSKLQILPETGLINAECFKATQEFSETSHDFSVENWDRCISPKITRNIHYPHNEELCQSYYSLITDKCPWIRWENIFSTNKCSNSFQNEDFNLSVCTHKMEKPISLMWYASDNVKTVKWKLYPFPSCQSKINEISTSCKSDRIFDFARCFANSERYKMLNNWFGWCVSPYLFLYPIDNGGGETDDGLDE